MPGSPHPTDVLVEQFAKSPFVDIMQNVDLVFGKQKEKGQHISIYVRVVTSIAAVLSFDHLRLYRRLFGYCGIRYFMHVSCFGFGFGSLS